MGLNRRERKRMEKDKGNNFQRARRVVAESLPLSTSESNIYVFAPSCATRDNERGITRTDYTGHETELGAPFINRVPIVSHRHNDAREALPEHSVNRLRFRYPFFSLVAERTFPPLRFLSLQLEGER